MADKFLQKLSGAQKNVLLKDFTTYKIGGHAKYFFSAKSKDDLMRLMFWASHKKKPICEKIKEWFEKNNLIETIVSKK